MLGYSPWRVFMNITLPLAICSALQTPGGKAAATRFSILSLLLSLIALGFSEWMARRTKAGRCAHASRG